MKSVLDTSIVDSLRNSKVSLTVSLLGQNIRLRRARYWNSLEIIADYVLNEDTSARLKEPEDFEDVET
jgi:hypothetical protein